MTGAPMSLAVLFVTRPDWILLRNIGIGIVVVLWLATAFWTFKDARRRIRDPWFVALATLIGLFPPFLGPIIYLFFRPPEYLQDVHERELEIKAMEQRLCGQPLDALWQVCPHCATPVATIFPALEDVTRAQQLPRPRRRELGQ
jgi:hypothetical protein